MEARMSVLDLTRRSVTLSHSVGAAFVLILLLSVLSTDAQTKPRKNFTNTGYYDDIKMTSKESGDYGGMSVYLTESDGQMFALVTTAEGAIGTPVLIEAKVTGKDMRNIEFTLPNDNGPRRFTGTISAAGLTLNESGSRTMLKRECANTYSNIKVGSGGDYGGTEVYLTDAGGTWFALVTVAEGVLMRPVLIQAKVTGKNYDRVDFTLPGDGGGRKFAGTLARNGLTVTEMGSRSVLKKKCYQ